VNGKRVGPGFRSGTKSVVNGASFVLQTPRIWPFAAVPVVILLLLSGLGVALALYFVPHAIGSRLPEVDSRFGEIATGTLSWMAALIVSVIALVLSLILTPPLSAPALEHIVRAREQALGVPSRDSLGFFRELACGLRALALATACLLPILGSLFVLDLLVPVVAPLTVAIKLLLASLSVAWNLFDYPLTLRGVGVRRRLALIRRHPGATLGFGVTFAALFWVPCFGILLLPIGVAAAAEIVAALARSDGLPEFQDSAMPNVFRSSK
jgi:uncharacterized protein involved in cysteine biosynthesis